MVKLSNSKGQFSLLPPSRLLQDSQIIDRFPQVATSIFFSLKVPKLNKYKHKGPSDKSQIYHKPFVKSTPFSSPLFHHERPTEKYHFGNTDVNFYLCLCALLFQISIKWSSEMQLGVINLKTWGSTKFHGIFWKLEFTSCCSVYNGYPPSNHFLSPPDTVFFMFCVKAV